MKVEDVNACSLDRWYKKFSRCTIETEILEIPSEVVRYLKDEGTIILPEGSLPSSQQYYNSDHEELHDEWAIHNNVQEDNIQEPKFDEFNSRIKTVIKNLGGSVFPKLNWSSPKDASWIALNNSLKCKFPGDVFLLLKSSNFITHDLTQCYKDCEDEVTNCDFPKYILALRKWIEMNPSNEFRCFVKDKRLIGICQRDPSQHYKCLQNELKSIKSNIVHFWREKIENLFPLSSYVFDVYRPTNNKVILLDFGPFGVTTDSLLFTWEELFNGLKTSEASNSNANVPEEHNTTDLTQSSDDVILINNLNIEDSNRVSEPAASAAEVCDPELRCITDDTGVQPSPYMQYGLPVDIIDLTTGQDPYKLVDFLKMTKNAQDQEEESSDEENDII